MKNKRPKSPCTKNCPRRNGECHSTCPDYATFVIDNELFKAELAELKALDRPTGAWYQTANGNWRHKR